MIFLVLSVLCSTSIFIIFRLFAKLGINNLYAIVGNYVVAATLGFFVAEEKFSISQIVHQKWFFGAIFIGLLFIALFQLMAKSTQTLGVAGVSVVVKMSVVLPVFAGFLLYNERLKWLPIVGIMLAIASVFLSTAKKSNEHKKTTIKLFWLAVLLFLGSGAIDVLLKFAEQNWLAPNEAAFFSATLFMSAFFWGLLFTIFQLKKNIAPKPIDLVGGILLGIPNFGSIYFLLAALSSSGWPSAAIYPVNNVAIVLLSAACGILFFKEKLNRTNWLGLALGVLAIVFIAFG